MKGQPGTFHPLSRARDDKDNHIQHLRRAPLIRTLLDSQVENYTCCLSLWEAYPYLTPGLLSDESLSQSDFSSFLTDICKRNRNAFDEAATHV